MTARALTYLALLLTCGAALAPVVSAAPSAGEIREQMAELYDVHAVAWAVNVGGGPHRSLDDVAYAADGSISGGQKGHVDSVEGVQDAGIYKSFRRGQLHLQKSLRNGVYDLTFHFVEPLGAAPGERIFDVLVQGSKRIEDLDISRIRGSRAPSALNRTITGVIVDDGELDIRLVSDRSEPVLSGLVVRERRARDTGWELAWADEFDYRGKPDPDRWHIQKWPPGQVNREAQAYTDQERNVRVNGDHLILEAHREDSAAAPYTSGRIHSRGRGDVLHGRVDVRARLPRGQGTWAAIWMLPSDPFRYATNCGGQSEWQGNDDCDAWPNSGEIDIMEHVGYDMNLVHGTVHNHSFSGGGPKHFNGSVEVRDVDQGFHVYSLEWTPERIDIFVDGSCYYSYVNEGAGWKTWPYDHPFHLVMNLAIGGDWGTAGGPIDNDIFPVSMEVDYVRVFKPARPQLRQESE